MDFFVKHKFTKSFELKNETKWGFILVAITSSNVEKGKSDFSFKFKKFDVFIFFIAFVSFYNLSNTA